jgi:hypothetical protein
VLASGRFGYVNQIEPDIDRDDWLFEILFEESGGAPLGRAEAATFRADELELVAVSGLDHEPEIELVVETTADEPAVVAAGLLQVVADELAVDAASYTVADRSVLIQLKTRDHPRPALRRIMARLGSSWLTEDDGWYANVTWTAQHFPVAGVDAARLFLRPWRDPRPGERLPGEPAERAHGG